MDSGGLLDALRQSLANAIPVQIGGFADSDHPFTSRGERPFRRRFWIQWRNVVLTGWPRHAMECSDGSQHASERTARPDALHRSRLTAQRYRELHACHRRPEDVDNDFYLCIGTIEAPDSLDSVTTSYAQDAVCRQLAAHVPLPVSAGLSNTFVALYERTELPLATTRPCRLDDACVTAEFIRRNLST